jgi:hypothetical protein
MPKPLRSTVASAVQSGPSHVEVIPRRSCRYMRRHPCRPVTRPTSIVLRVCAIRLPQHCGCAISQSVDKALQDASVWKKQKHEICGHNIQRIRAGRSTADRFTAKSRHVPTLYSRQASSHTREAAKSKSDSCCTTFSNIGGDDLTEQSTQQPNMSKHATGTSCLF